MKTTQSLTFLLAQAKQGDSAALDTLVSQFQIYVYRYTRKRVSELQDAEDIAQEVMIRFVKHIRRVRKDTHIKPWLTKVASRLIIDFYRKHKSLPLSPEFDLASRENLARTRSMKLDIAKAMGSLSQQKEAIVRLYYFESLSYVQIAERLQLSLSSVKVELHRAKLQLRKSLAGYAQYPALVPVRA